MIPDSLLIAGVALIATGLSFTVGPAVAAIFVGVVLVIVGMGLSRAG